MFFIVYAERNIIKTIDVKKRNEVCSFYDRKQNLFFSDNKFSLWQSFIRLEKRVQSIGLSGS